MKNILILVFSDLTHDARVRRQIKWLAEHHQLTVVCFKKGVKHDQVTYREISMIPLSKLRKAMLAMVLLLRIYRLAYWLQHGYYNRLKDLKTMNFDVILANDIETLPLAHRLSQKDKTRLIFDAHEYAPRHFEERLWWRVCFAPWYNAMCRKYIPKLAAMTTVSNGLALEYEREFGVKPSLVTNAPAYKKLSPVPVSNPIRLVHHGIVNKSRKLESMIDLMKQLGEGYSLDIYLMIPEYASGATFEYYNSLKTTVANTTNVRILPKLDNDKIITSINGYDIGLFLLEPVNFNYTYALPNKLFDFVQARLAIAIGPSLEMKQVVENYDLGVVSESFSPTTLANDIKKLSSKDIYRHKQRADAAAYELSEERNKETLLAIIDT